MLCAAVSTPRWAAASALAPIPRVEKDMSAPYRVVRRRGAGAVQDVALPDPAWAGPLPGP